MTDLQYKKNGLKFNMKADVSKCSVIISGGTQGLGLAIAKNLAFQGCKKIILSGRDEKKGYKAAKEISSYNSKCLFIKSDVSKTKDCQNLFNKSLECFEDINCLVNSAAITTRGSIQDTSLELWDDHMNTNLRGPFILMQSLVNYLIAKKRSGSIVNILSISSYVGQSFLTAYCVSKGGLMTLTKNTANALKKHKIRVNGIAPGWMDTPGEDYIQKKFHNAKDGWLEEAESKQPFGKLGKPEEIAPIVTYLLSPNSGIITGSIIDYDQNIVGSLPE